jgi:hypothetical protein
MPDIDESEIRDLVRRAVRATYPPAQLHRDVAYVDVHYEQFDQGSHLLRARAPDHELLAFDRWLVVTVAGQRVHLRGDGQAGPTEYYVRARIEPE